MDKHNILIHWYSCDSSKLDLQAEWKYFFIHVSIYSFLHALLSCRRIFMLGCVLDKIPCALPCQYSKSHQTDSTRSVACGFGMLFVLRKPQTPSPSPQKKKWLKIATLMLLDKRNLCSLESKISFLLPGCERVLFPLPYFLLRLLTALIKCSLSLHEHRDYFILLPFSLLLRFVVITGDWVVCTASLLVSQGESKIFSLRPPFHRLFSLRPSIPQTVFFFPHIGPENTAPVKLIVLKYEHDSHYFIFILFFFFPLIIP